MDEHMHVHIVIIFLNHFCDYIRHYLYLLCVAFIYHIGIVTFVVDCFSENETCLYFNSAS